MKSRKLGFLLNFLFCFSLFYVSVFIAWQALSLVDFGYSALYGRLDIAEMSKKYPLQNEDLNKRFFAFTDRAEHERLFGEIVRSINSGGKGLEDIAFNIEQTEQPFTLLNYEEVLHLMDVADVVLYFKLLAYFFILAAVFSFIAMLNLRIPPVRIRAAIPATFGFIGASFVVLLIVGPKNVFYFLHEVIFKENKWFFYYQESLMTVVMHAPDIFGWIAAMLVVFGFAVYCILLYSSGYIYRVAVGIK